MASFGSNSVLVEQSWTALKAICQAKELSIQYDETETIYQCFAIDRPIVYVCVIYKEIVPVGDQGQNDLEKLDFETNYKEACNLRLSERLDTANNQVTTNTYSSIDDSGRFLGDYFVASGMATTIHDFKVDSNLRISGADWWTTGQEWGDFGSFAVVDKDDVLGLFQIYGLEPGEVLELKKYVVDVPLPASEACPYFTQTMEVVNPAFICSGLYLRCIVNNNHNDDMNVGAVYHVYLE